jgi:hypothetical protein
MQPEGIEAGRNLNRRIQRRATVLMHRRIQATKTLGTSLNQLAIGIADMNLGEWSVLFDGGFESEQGTAVCLLVRIPNQNPTRPAIKINVRRPAFLRAKVLGTYRSRDVNVATQPCMFFLRCPRTDFCYRQSIIVKHWTDSGQHNLPVT